MWSVCGKLRQSRLFASLSIVPSVLHVQSRQSRPLAGGARAPALVVLVLMLAIMLRLYVAWQDWSAMADTATPVPGERPSVAVDVPAVQALGLFGGNAARAGSPLGNLATTELDLRLDGVVLATPAERSLAFIVSGGQQHSYRSGDELPVGDHVTLAGVAQDHVRIRNGGVEQVLWLYRKGEPAPAAAKSAMVSAGTAPRQTVVPAAAQPQAAQQQISKVAGRLAEIIEVSPAISNGHMLGYRLAAGAHIKEFVQLGFKQGDILTSVNGIALNDMANLPELYNLMNRPADVSFSLLRDGQPLTLQMTMTP